MKGPPAEFSPIWRENSETTDEFKLVKPKKKRANKTNAKSKAKASCQPKKKIATENYDRVEIEPKIKFQINTNLEEVNSCGEGPSPSSPSISEPIKTEIKVVENISSKSTEISEKTATESLNLTIATADDVTITPKPIMISYSEGITDIIRKIAQDCGKKFHVKIASSSRKLFADSLPIKEKNH